MEESRKAAVEHVGRSISLSASAGSGKTHILTKRIIERLKNGGDVSRLLIVTFTVAAAAEIRTRIRKALAELIESEPDNPRYRDQLMRADKAEISTIDSFCLRVVRRNFEAAGVSPDFRIADATAYKLLCASVASETVDILASDPANRPLFENVLAGSDNDSLEDVLISCYEKLGATAFPERYFDKTRAVLDEPYENSSLLKSLYKDVADFLIYLDCALSKLMSAASADSDLHDVLNKVYTPDKIVIDKLHSAASKCDHAAYVAVAGDFKLDRFDNKKDYKDNVLIKRYEAFRDEFRKVINKYVGLVKFTEEEYKREHASLKETVNCLERAVKLYSDMLSAELKDRNIMSFPEIQRKCFDLLVKDEKDGDLVPTELAVSLSSRYDEIMIDEYQDTNSVQDMIFRAVSDRENNIFIVGDDKQSIYGFRNASPEIFRKKLISGKSEHITLSRNFRCREEIINAVNAVFCDIMRSDTGLCDYSKEAKLIAGADCYGFGKGSVTLSLFEHEKDKSNGATDAENEEEDLTAVEREADYTARKIKSILESGVEIYDKAADRRRPVRPSDIAVMSRAGKGVLDVYAAKFAEYGLDAGFPENDSYFEKYEISAVVSLLKIIDNPTDSLTMAAVMRSPLFGFTDGELAEIMANHGGNFAAAVNSAYSDNDKVKDFIDKVASYRRLANEIPVYTLLNHIYSDLKVEAIFFALDKTERSFHSLIRLITVAENYEKSSIGGLYGFLTYVDDLIENGKNPDVDASSTVKDGEYIRVMTIHGSKGLEFPICFLVGIFKAFRFKDAYDKLIFSDKYGVCMKLTENNSRVVKNTLSHFSAENELKSKSVKEEMRLLYVAMTRAREHLYIVGSNAQIKDKVAAACETGLSASSWKINHSNSFAEMLLPVFLHGSASDVLRQSCGAPPSEAGDLFDLTVETDFDAEKFQKSAFETSLTELSETALKSASKRVPTNFEGIPEKLSVSEIKAGERERAEDAAMLYESYDFTARPRFASDRPDGRDRGNAIHKFLRYANWNDLIASKTDCETVAADLSSKNVFTDAEKKVLDLDLLKAFFANPFTAGLMTLGKAYREKRFTIELPAARFITDASADDRVVVQGIIDMFVQTENGIILVDYKTDKIDPDSDGKELIEKYSTQLEIYAAALERMYGVSVNEKYIYSFALGKYLSL